MSDVDSLTLKWIEGLAGFNTVFIELIPGEKRSPRNWNLYEANHAQNGGSCLEDARRWLRTGKGLGVLLREDLWALDVDSSSAVETVLSSLAEARICPPWLRTPSGGAHFYFRKPLEFISVGRLKNHLCHPRDSDGTKLDMDFKLGPRTLLVAPGTRRKGKQYAPQSIWSTPPVLDPRFFLPDGDFWMPPNRPFLVDSRPLDRRIARACVYLRSLAPVSISESGGRKALAAVASHLVAFLQLDPALAVHLLTHGEAAWNSRCRRSDGNPFPWPMDDLWRACTDAVDSVPAAGVLLFKRGLEREKRDKSLSTFMALMHEARVETRRNRVWVNDLRAIFESWSGKAVSGTAFGRALTANGFTRINFSRAKLPGVESVDPELLRNLLSEELAA